MSRNLIPVSNIQIYSYHPSKPDRAPTEIRVQGQKSPIMTDGVHPTMVQDGQVILIQDKVPNPELNIRGQLGP